MFYTPWCFCWMLAIAESTLMAFDLALDTKIELVKCFRRVSPFDNYGITHWHSELRTRSYSVSCETQLQYDSRTAVQFLPTHLTQACTCNCSEHNMISPEVSQMIQLNTMGRHYIFVSDVPTAQSGKY